jgi:hypothetical protein
MALSGHGFASERCLLSGVERTKAERLTVSAYDPKQTSTTTGIAVCYFALPRHGNRNRQSGLWLGYCYGQL